MRAAEVRRQRIAHKGYTEDARPTVQTITTQLNALGDFPKKVAKRQPPKKIPETDAIFAQVTRINQAADAADEVLRLSVDAKATVTVGPFARGGKSRVQVAAVDHDVQPEATVTPVGIFLPALAALCVYGVTSTVTRDCLVDCLAQWWESVRARFPPITPLVINLENGPENHRRRTQCMQRIVACVRQYPVHVRLAYDPPSHSQYNPIERCWGILENPWNGALLDAIEAVRALARTMTWDGRHPVVERVTTTYQTGVKLTTEAMAGVEAQIQ